MTASRDRSSELATHSILVRAVAGRCNCRHGNPRGSVAATIGQACPADPPGAGCLGWHRVAGSRAGARHAEPQDEAPQNAVRTQPVTIGPRSGQPLPPLPPDLAVGSSTQENPQYHAQPVDRDTLRRARGGLLRLGDGVYRGRRPALLAVMAVLTVLFEVAFFRVL